MADKMISIRFTIKVFLLFLASIELNAQQSHTLFFMHTIPQANYTNPAVQIPCRIFIGFPLLSSVHLNYSNSYFAYKNVIGKNSAGEVVFNPDYLLRNLNSRQQMNVELQIALINFGFRYKEYYFNFDLHDKLDVGLAYPTNLAELALNGNAAYIGRTMDLNGLGLFGNYYREWAIGVSKIMDEYLTLGIKAKLLFGKASISTSRSDLSLYTSDPVYNLRVQSEVEGKASPLVLELDPNGRLITYGLPEDASVASLLLNRKNPGFALDFGAIYQYNEQITLSGSLLDIGFIRYRYNAVVGNGTADYQYNGIDYGPGVTSYYIINQIRTDLRNSYVFSTKNRPYSKFLAPKLYLGGTYEFKPWANAGFLLRNELYNGKLRSSATGSVNAWYKNYLSGSLSWSYINGSLLNFGAGIGLRTPQAGLYIISDNIYGALKYKSARLINIRFGINFLFGCTNKSKTAALDCPAYIDEKPKKVSKSKWRKKLSRENGLFE